VKGLVRHGYKIISTGGTARVLREAGVEIMDVSELVGGNPIMGDKVKTLSREVAAGLLGRRDVVEEIGEMNQLKLPIIDLVCVDMYPLEATIEESGHNLAMVLSKTDVGGPTMLHEGAKGVKITVSTFEQRQAVLDWLEDGRPNEEEFVNELNGMAEYQVARYVGLSADSRSEGAHKVVPLTDRRELLYGINPWSEASVYRVDIGGKKDPLAYYNFRLVAGREQSTNNLDDWNRALAVMTHLAAVNDINFDTVKVYAEAANTPTTLEADEIIKEKGVYLIPDFLCNAGGVTVSYFEEVQNNMNYYWSREEVLEKLDRIMTNAFNAVADLAEERKCYTRDAAYLISLQRVARAIEGRGWVKPKK